MNILFVTLSVLVFPIAFTAIVSFVLPKNIEAGFYPVVYCLTLTVVAYLFVKNKGSKLSFGINFKDTLLAVFAIALIDRISAFLFGSFPIDTEVGNVYLFFAGTVLLAPLSEEFAFRRVLLTMYLRKFSKCVSVVLSSFIWTLAHLPFELNIFVSVFFAGIVLSILFQGAGLASAIAAHFLINLVFFISVITRT